MLVLLRACGIDTLMMTPVEIFAGVIIGKKGLTKKYPSPESKTYKKIFALP